MKVWNNYRGSGSWNRTNRMMSSYHWQSNSNEEPAFLVASTYVAIWSLPILLTSPGIGRGDTGGWVDTGLDFATWMQQEGKGQSLSV